jgi:hypothetical protein
MTPMSLSFVNSDKLGFVYLSECFFKYFYKKPHFHAANNKLGIPRKRICQMTQTMLFAAIFAS